MEWPDWWEWELELSSHVENRMEDRDFTEVELRQMLEGAGSYRSDVVEGRWLIEARRGRERWEVVVQPDSSEKLLVVVTAYPAQG